ncbi:U3 small nucleolar RNA-associated protein 18 homolog [Aricia agestis]|uniref:U3 small nucleolar RNA-associated protein 18 homolog n=1 Tax=Aricia agestis TaxID=91739 RepID=UPI001C20A293|nr:U3 small nucleolar RNA-associated protein 18 homolog [Aricia agestis]
MKRKTSTIDEEEAGLSSILFNKSKKLSNNLAQQTKIECEIDIKPVWVDEDDETLKTSIVPKAKNDGLYVQKLKQRYETLVGTPSWAKILKSEKQERTEEDKLLKSVGHLKRATTKGLKKEYLEVRSFPKINSETRNEGAIISCTEFHPKMSVALVAGHSGIVSLFSIGGETNHKLHSFNLKKWKVTTAQFNPDGTEAYIASNISHDYCVYNLVKAEPKLVQLPRVVKKPTNFTLSPDGKLIATSDGFDEVYIVCIESRELIRSLKHNSKVQSLCFSNDSSQLFTYGVQGEVTFWDLSTYRAKNKFFDHGCVTASCITTSHCGRLIATGSGEGIVNIYDTTKIDSEEPLPQKIISNLRTKVSHLKFNPTTEILSANSYVYPNALKLIHIPSYTVFSNFPSENLHQIQTVSFSPNSGYLALGNNKGSAYLYRLKHYKNY